jgi:hypothetical protein
MRAVIGIDGPMSRPPAWLCTVFSRSGSRSWPMPFRGGVRLWRHPRSLCSTRTHAASNASVSRNCSAGTWCSFRRSAPRRSVNGWHSKPPSRRFRPESPPASMLALAVQLDLPAERQRARLPDAALLRRQRPVLHLREKPYHVARGALVRRALDGDVPGAAEGSLALQERVSHGPPRPGNSSQLRRAGAIFRA